MSQPRPWMLVGWTGGCLALVLAAGALARAAVADRVVRARVAGLDLVVCPTAVHDVVSIRGSLPAGDAHTAGGNPTIAALAAMLLEAGTTQHDKFALEAKLDEAGASLRFATGRQRVTINGRCLRADLPLVLALLAEQLRTPAFADEEFEKARRRYRDALRAQLDAPGFLADDAFTRAVYPAGHPNAAPSVQNRLAAAGEATVAEVRAFHARHYGPAHLVLVIVGDVDVAAVQAEVSRVFAGWRGGSAIMAAPATAASPPGGTQDVFVADKTSVNVVWGAATGLPAGDPDHPALEVATAILGDGFSGRLMSVVRDREGLTYGIYAGLGNDLGTGGDWRISATFAPALLDRGIAAMRREFDQWYRDGVTAAELAARQTNLAGSFQVSLATTGGLASALLEAINAGHDVTWVDEYPRRIQALTLEEVNAALRRYLDPARLVLVRAGTLPAAP